MGFPLRGENAIPPRESAVAHQPVGATPASPLQIASQIQYSICSLLPGTAMGKLSYSWELMKASWNILRQDAKLLIFPLLSGICCLIVIASFAVPVIMSGHAQLPNQD